jgi:hypothetical protein
MQIPVLNGIYTDRVADIRTAYPVNMVPVPKQHGVSNGYLRPADGIALFGAGPGNDRGGINWNGVCYRVMGTKLVRLDSGGTPTTLGDVGGFGQVSFGYSFDYLAVSSGGKLFLWSGSSLQQVTDSDLGLVIDFVWVDGYFLTTDGTSLVVTELNDPFAVNPLKYGSSEIDPDPVKGVLKLHNEVYAVNRYTIEVFNNVGGEGFPFQRVDGAQIPKGSIGTHSCCLFVETIAFLGSGKNEAPAIYLGASAQAGKISTHEIDTLLLDYTEEELEDVLLEARVDRGHQHLYVHLPDRTIVYDETASGVLEEPVWFTLTSSIDGFSKYRARNLVWCYNQWLCGDPDASRVGVLVNHVADHYGDTVRWEFGTLMVYNKGKGAIVHQLELVCITGRVAFGTDPQISTSYSKDGETWSQDKSKKVGQYGDRLKRIVWLKQGNMRNWRVQRFRGDSQAFISIARLEAELEPLMV